MLEEMICPRRQGRDEYLPDRWNTDRWAQDREGAKFPNFQPPRTCSFCGGAHPEDLIELLRLGWEVGETDKPYKRYMHPPGFRLHQERWSSWMVNQRSGGSFFDHLGYVDPTPPVKLYTQHFSESQVNDFNAILEERYRNIGAVDTEQSM
jgi:hypothetical protein